MTAMYNRWMPQEYQSGGELYHYGVKGMKWKNKKGVQIQSQEAQITGGRLPAAGTEYIPQQDSAADATYRKMQEYQEAHKPAWQKKWDKSSAKKTLSKIMSKIKSKKPKKKKKSGLTVTFSDGTSKKL